MSPNPFTYKNEVFKNKAVRLDDTVFIDCVFDGCQLLYSGSAAVIIQGGEIMPTCRIKLDGPANLTLRFLAAMYGQPVLRQSVEEAIAFMRGETPPPIAPSN